MQDVEELARDGLTLLLHAVLIQGPVHGQKQLVAVLLDDEPDQLLIRRKKRQRSRQGRPRTARHSRITWVT